MLGLFLCFIILVVVLVLVGQAQAKARREKFGAFVAVQGWSFFPDRRRDPGDDFPGMPLFGQGSNRYAENLLRGTFQNCTVMAFDYHYETIFGTGDDRRTINYWFTVVMASPGFPLKPLMIRKSGFFDSIASFFGNDDINFESAEFSRRYHVTAPERRWAFDVITPQNIEFLMHRNPDALTMNNSWLMLYESRVDDPSAILPLFSTVTGLLERMPEYVRHQATQAS